MIEKLLRKLCKQSRKSKESYTKTVTAIQYITTLIEIIAKVFIIILSTSKVNSLTPVYIAILVTLASVDVIDAILFWERNTENMVVVDLANFAISLFFLATSGATLDAAITLSLLVVITYSLLYMTVYRKILYSRRDFYTTD